MTTVPTPSPPNYLDDGGSAFAPTGGGAQTGYGLVSGTAASFYIGAGATAWNGVAVLNVTALATANGQTYTLAIQGATSSSFSSPVTLGTIQVAAVGQYLVPVYAYFGGVLYPYLRLEKIVTGTAPSITLNAFPLPFSGLSSLSLQDATAVFGLAAQNLQQIAASVIAWASGTPTGGPNANGYYPIYDAAGDSTLVPCPAVAPVGLFTAIPTKTIPTGTNLIATSGYRTIGVGAATYAVSTASGLTAGPTTTQSADGRWWVLCEDEIAPEMFGAVGTGSSTPASTYYATLSALQAAYPFASSLYQEMDWLGWQAALNYGGFIVAPVRTYKMCNANAGSMQPLTVVAGQSWARCAGATFDWTAMVAQTAVTHEVANYNFASSSGWENAPQYTSSQRTVATFGGGAATCTDPGGSGPFYQFGYQVTLQPGRYVATMTSTATLGASYHTGNNNPAYGSINLFSTQPGTGQLFSGASLNNLYQLPSGASVTQTILFDFQITTATTCWLTFTGGGYLSLSVTNFDINPYVANAAILATRDGAGEHYPLVQPMSGMQITGPGSGSGVTGILYKSFSNLDGNVVSFDKTSVSNFGTGLSLQDGAYLTEFVDFNTIGCGTGVSFPGGFNAGENFRFYGGGFTNGQIGISNPGGAEFTLYGSAIDYNTQAIVQNAGRIELHGVHAEMNMPTTAGYPLFQCVNGGRISWFGGMFLGAGTVGTAPEPPINLASAYCSMAFFGTEIYNLYSAGYGVACSGPGVIHSSGVRWKGNPNVGAISTATAMDLLGGAGGFEGGANPSQASDPTGINLIGGVWPTGGTISGRWTNTEMPAALSTAYAHSGTKSLSFAKSSGYGTNDEVMLLFPVKQGQFVIPSFWWLAPGNVGTGTASLYVRMAWVQLIGFDAYDRPVLNGTAYEFRGEQDISINLAGSTTWTQWTYPTPYNTDSTSLTADVSPGAPAWATHFMLLFDTESLPAMTFYLDDIVATAL